MTYTMIYDDGYDTDTLQNCRIYQTSSDKRKEIHTCIENKQLYMHRIETVFFASVVIFNCSNPRMALSNVNSEKGRFEKNIIICY